MIKTSVIIPTFNRAKYLKEAINSVLNQTVQHFEIIVVDDGSIDSTKESISTFKDKVKYLYQANAGVSRARNLGLKYASGDYVAFLDSDDIWKPYKLEKQINYLEKHNKTAVVHSWVDIINEKSQVILNEEFPSCRQEGMIFEDLLLCKSKVVISTLVLKKECIKNIGLFDETLRTTEDTNYILRLAKSYNFGFVRERLVSKRDHANNLTNQAFKNEESNGTFKNIEKIFILFPQINSKLKSHALLVRYYHYGYINLISGSKKNSRLFYRKALKYKPFNLKLFILLFLTFLPSRIVISILKKREKEGKNEVINTN